MPTSVQELLEFQPLIDELTEARAATDEYGNYRGSGDRLADAENSIKYKRAKQAEEQTTRKVTDGINAAPAEVLSDAQKAIAVKVLAHIWRDPMPKNMKLIRDGFNMFERVQKGAEKNRGTIAVLGEETLALYDSKGADDISVTPISWAYGHKEIHYVLHGHEIAISNPKNESFPDPVIKEATFNKTGLHASCGNNAAEELSSLLPNSSDLPLIRLGTAEKPREKLDSYLESDAERFAARLLVANLGKQGWIKVSAPGDGIRGKIISEFANTYTDLLVGETPRDAVKHVRGVHSRNMNRTHVQSSTLRRRSLASLLPTERNNIFYAADTTAEEVEAKTRERIAKLTEATTPAGIAGALRAQQLVDPFFHRLAELSEV